MVMLENIKRRIRKSFKIKSTCISCSMSFVAFLLVFVSGFISNETKDEVCADYYSQISLKHTIGGGDKKLAGLIVEPKTGHDVSMAYDTQTEINNIWGAFKGENASYAPVINANKETDIRFAGEEGAKYSTNRISILYSTVGDSTEIYHSKRIIDPETKKEIVVPVDYKFQCSPLATMFSSVRGGMQSQLYIYISQKQAENKLKADGVQKIDEESLRSLLNTTVDIDFNGELRTCIIHNIYLDNFEHECKFPNLEKKYNYYYGTDVGTILGDYIFISTYAIESKVIPNCLLSKQGMYFMSEYSYRNRFYFEYARNCYSPADYSFNYATSNLKEGFIPDDSILQAAVNAVNINAGCALLTALLSLIFVANLIFAFLFKLYRSLLSIALIMISSIMPYLIFRLVFVVTRNVFVFSSYSTILNLVLLIILSILIFSLAIFSRTLKKKENSNV